MSFLSSIKKIGRAIDPTSKTAPLGSLVRTAVGVLPGGGALMGAVDVGAQVKATVAPNKPAAQPQVLTPAAPPPAPSMGEKFNAFATSTGGISVGLLAAAGLLLVLLFRRK